MLRGLQLDCEARVDTKAIQTYHRCALPALCSCRNRSRPFRQTRRSPALSKPRTVQTRCSFAAAVSHTSVTAQSVTDAVAKATLDKPLFQHALHSIFSSLAWFGLAWIVTRYIGRKSKECESPEVTLLPAAACRLHAKFKPASSCLYRSRHQLSCQSYLQLYPGSSVQFMSMRARHCLLPSMYLLQSFCPWPQWCTRCAP